MEYLLIWGLLKIVDDEFSDPSQPLPIEHRTPSSTSTGVKTNNSTSAPMSEIPPTADLNPSMDLELWFGAGVNLISYNQNSGALSEISYSDFAGQDFSVSMGSSTASQWDWRIKYQTTLGEFSSEESVTFINEKYRWDSLTGDIIWYLSPNNESQSYGIVGGAKYNKMPFLVPIAFQTGENREVQIAFASVGGLFRKTGRQFDWEAMIKYQHPVGTSATNSNKIDISPELFIDASVGLEKKMSQQMKWGVFWSSQWLRYSFDYYDAIATDTEYTGHQEVLYSAIEARFGFSF